MKLQEQLEKVQKDLEKVEERRKELQKKEKELRTKIELETAKAEVKKNEEVDGADLEAFRQFMQEQAGKRKQQEEEFKGYDLGGI